MTTAVTGRLARFFGAPAAWSGLLTIPAIVVVIFDRVVRGRFVATGTGTEWGVYLLGVAIGGALWATAAWMLAKLWAAPRRRGFTALLVLGVLPAALLTFSVELAYFRYASTYSSATTLPIAWQLRGTVKTALLGSWSTALPGVLCALAFVVGLALLARRLSTSLREAEPLVPLALVVTALVLVFGDRTWTRGVSPLPPDASVVASMVGAVFEHQAPRGLSVRDPSPVPAPSPSLFAAKPRRSVVLVVTESVRADVLLSAPDASRPSPLDAIIGDRLPLTRMTSQASSTIISCFSTWTGLPPDVDVATAHRAPLIFELAHAAGYRTVYVGAQRGDFQRLGTFLQVAGLDSRVFGEELDAHAHEEAGAPDERATRRALDELAADARPTLLVLHLSSTHYPYRVDERYVPFQPMTTAMSQADKPALWNRYRNAVLLQEHILADFFRELRAAPGREELVSVLVSDHGEQFYEHGAFSHIRSLHDEELRVPGFVVAGPRGLEAEERRGLAAYRDRRVYNQDIHATLLDLLGLFDEAKRAPFAAQRTGRSLLRVPLDDTEPAVGLANANGIWGIDRPMFGAMWGEKKLMRRENEPFVCFDVASDPTERVPLGAASCGRAAERAARLFALP